MRDTEPLSEFEAAMAGAEAGFWWGVLAVWAVLVVALIVAIVVAVGD